MTATTQAPPKETWRDWMHPDTPEPEPLLTRAEFLDRVRAEGGDVSERSLVHWENIGVRPTPGSRRRPWLATTQQWSLGGMMTSAKSGQHE